MRKNIYFSLLIKSTFGARDDPAPLAARFSFSFYCAWTRDLSRVTTRNFPYSRFQKLRQLSIAESVNEEYIYSYVLPIY